MNINSKDPQTDLFNPDLVRSILTKLGPDNRNANRSLAKLSFDELYKRLSPDETAVIKQLLELKPKDYGFLGSFITMDGPAPNLMPLDSQSFVRNRQEHIIPTQYLPKPVWLAFQKLQSAIKSELGSTLLAESGYRSPAHQSVTFLTYLEMSNFNINYVTKGVALPGYSQHGDPVNTAIDLINQDGIPTDQEPHLFANTKEYDWLTKAADKFGFYLSYPLDNEFGVKYEPWHWQYRG